jgi:MFS family permease
MTLGQLIGPPLGALSASKLGYKGAFISASALVFVTLMFCFFYVAEVSREPKGKTTSGKHTVNIKTLTGWTLCFVATVQLMFLPSILPNVFQGFNIDQTVALNWAGLVVMLYTATAMAGTYFLCRLAGRIRRNKLIISVGVLGTILQMLLSISPGVISFVAIRVLQTGIIASVLPLVFSAFASESDGKVIGFLNSGRFAGNALGPMIAASVLAFSTLTWLYLAIGTISILAVLSFAVFFGRGEDSVSQGEN